MKVTVIRPFLGNEGMVTEGMVLDVSDNRADELEKHGLVVGVVGGKTQLRGAVKVGSPIKPPQTGGLFGAESKPLLSPVAQPRRTRTYHRPRAKPEQE